MIVSDKFVWLHFPKCAGHAVEQALRSVLRSAPDVAFDRPGDDSINWHDTLEDRRRRDPGLALHERTVICGFRRLPHWMLSRVHYEASRPPYHCVTRAMLCRGEFFHQNGQVGKADAYIKHYGASKVDRWMVGPSASGSLNGTPTSRTSAIASAARSDATLSSAVG